MRLSYEMCMDMNVSSVTNYNTSTEAKTTPEFFTPAIYTLSLVVFLLAIPLNTLTIVVLVSRDTYKASTTALLVSLVSSDLVYSVSAIIFSSLGLAGVPLDDLTARSRTVGIFHYCWMFATGANYGSYLLVSLDLWLYLAHPYFYTNHIGKKVIASSIIFIWVTAPTFNLVWLFTEGMYLAAVYLVPICHTVSNCTVIAVYTHITIISYRQMNAISKVAPANNENPNKYPTLILNFLAKRLRSAKMLLMAFTAFVLTLSPFVYVNAAFELHSQDPALLVVRNVTLMASSFHYCTSFFVISAVSREFRKEAKDYVTQSVSNCPTCQSLTSPAIDATVVSCTARVTSLWT